MEKKMEELKNTSRPLDNNGGWETQVNGRADEKKAEEQRRIISWAEQQKAEEQRRISWAEQQKAKHIAEKRIRRIMNLIAFALALIVGGGIYLNYVEGFPIYIAAAIIVIGNSLLWFVLGWIFGHKERR